MNPSGILAGIAVAFLLAGPASVGYAADSCDDTWAHFNYTTTNGIAADGYVKVADYAAKLQTLESVGSVDDMTPYGVTIYSICNPGSAQPGIALMKKRKGGPSSKELEYIVAAWPIKDKKNKDWEQWWKDWRDADDGVKKLKILEGMRTKGMLISNLEIQGKKAAATTPPAATPPPAAKTTTPQPANKGVSTTQSQPKAPQKKETEDQATTAPEPAAVKPADVDKDVWDLIEKNPNIKTADQKNAAAENLQAYKKNSPDNFKKIVELKKTNKIKAENVVSNVFNPEASNSGSGGGSSSFGGGAAGAFDVKAADKAVTEGLAAPGNGEKKKKIETTLAAIKALTDLLGSNEDAKADIKKRLLNMIDEPHRVSLEVPIDQWVGDKIAADAQSVAFLYFLKGADPVPGMEDANFLKGIKFRSRRVDKFSLWGWDKISVPQDMHEDGYVEWVNTEFNKAVEYAKKACDWTDPKESAALAALKEAAKKKEEEEAAKGPPADKSLHLKNLMTASSQGGTFEDMYVTGARVGSIVLDPKTGKSRVISIKLTSRRDENNDIVNEVSINDITDRPKVYGQRFQLNQEGESSIALKSKGFKYKLKFEDGQITFTGAKGSSIKTSDSELTKLRAKQIQNSGVIQNFGDNHESSYLRISQGGAPYGAYLYFPADSHGRLIGDGAAPDLVANAAKLSPDAGRVQHMDPPLSQLGWVTRHQGQPPEMVYLFWDKDLNRYSLASWKDLSDCTKDPQFCKKMPKEEDFWQPPAPAKPEDKDKKEKEKDKTETKGKDGAGDGVKSKNDNPIDTPVVTKAGTKTDKKSTIKVGDETAVEPEKFSLDCDLSELPSGGVEFIPVTDAKVTYFLSTDGGAFYLCVNGDAKENLLFGQGIPVWDRTRISEDGNDLIIETVAPVQGETITGKEAKAGKAEGAHYNFASGSPVRLANRKVHYIAVSDISPFALHSGAINDEEHTEIEYLQHIAYEKDVTTNKIVAMDVPIRDTDPAKAVAAVQEAFKKPQAASSQYADPAQLQKILDFIKSEIGAHDRDPNTYMVSAPNIRIQLVQKKVNAQRDPVSVVEIAAKGVKTGTKARGKPKVKPLDYDEFVDCCQGKATGCALERLSYHNANRGAAH